MVRLVSVSKIDSTDDLSRVTSERPEGQTIRNCSVNVDHHQMKLANHYPSNKTIDLQWENISLVTKKGKQILKELSGTAHSGELTAIMGPSGAGKTSLLNVLSCFTRHKVTGRILVNGSGRDMRTFPMLTTYILQDDHILTQLTVRETVSIAASLKIPSRISKRDRENAVDDCLRCLDLVNQQNLRAGNLSGGQRKRLCIAQELVSNPPLIFLDEPTSGLDSSACFRCVQLLKTLAEGGKTVLCTIHQPSSKIFKIFDNLYMLASGHCIYRGSVQNLVTFLSAQGLHCQQYHNPADYVTEVAVGHYGEWTEKLRDAINAADNTSRSSSSCLYIPGSDSVQSLTLQSSTISLIHKESMEKLETTHSSYATSSLNQFKVLFYRNVLYTLRDPINIQVQLIGTSLISILLGILFYGIGNDGTKAYNNVIVLFCTLTLLIICAMIPSVLTFPLRRKVYERELMNSWYSTGMYYLATICAEFPFQLFYPVISCSIVYWMTGQPSDVFRFGLYLVCMFTVTLVAESIGQLIGAVTNVQNAIVIATATATYILTFCGFFITFRDMPSYLTWILYASFGRYALQSVVLVIYSMDRPPLHCDNTTNLPEQCLYQDPTVILKELEMDDELHVDYSVMIGLFIALRIATYWVLKSGVKRMHA